MRPAFRFLEPEAPLSKRFLLQLFVAGLLVAALITEIRAAQLHLQPVQTSVPTIYGCPQPEAGQILIITVARLEDDSLDRTCATAMSRGAYRRAAR